MTNQLSLAIQDLKFKGLEITAINQIVGGRNSSIYKINNAESREHFILKLYKKPTDLDNRDRLSTEREFLNYLGNCGFQKSPNLVHFSDNNYWSLMSFIDGNKVRALNQNDLHQVVKFLTSINSNEHLDARKNLPLASEAITSPQQIIKSVEKRFKIFQAVQPNSNEEEKIYQWINISLRPRMEIAVHELLKKQKREYWHTDDFCSHASPSDIGVHNMLRRHKELYFIDFEYAGIDDLSKCFSDLILQPEYLLTSEQEQCLLSLACSLMGIERKQQLWLYRLEDIKPLIMIKWCLIMLKDFGTQSISQQQFHKAKDYFMLNRHLCDYPFKARSILTNI